MSPDRYGDTPEPPCPHDCRKGWLTGPNSDHPRPCPVHKPHLAGGTTSTTNYAERPPSARAQQAIDKENHE